MVKDYKRKTCLLILLKDDNLSIKDLQSYIFKHGSEAHVE